MIRVGRLPSFFETFVPGANFVLSNNRVLMMMHLSGDHTLIVNVAVFLSRATLGI
jgi:hypothetical protein